MKAATPGHDPLIGNITEMTPTVSVIIPSYNHANFIAEAIQSVLDQTYQDFEIVITDDGSKDNSIEIIEQFQDDRIRLFKFNTNQGACAASNNCIRQSKGKYVAMLSSDDAWLPGKLEKQVAFLDAHPLFGAVFSRIQWVDEQSIPISEPDFYYANVFDVDNRSRFQWLNHFFYRGNCLCHPSSLIRREIYDEVGYLDPSLANLPDFDLWIRICLKYEIFILDEKLVRFRHFEKESNASGNTVTNGIRVHYESGLLLDNYLKFNTLSELERAFPSATEIDGVQEADIPFLLGKLAVETGQNFKVLWGLNQIHKAFQVPGYAERTKNVFNFGYLDFIKQSGHHDIYRLAELLAPSVTPPVELNSSTTGSIDQTGTRRRFSWLNILPRRWKNRIHFQRDYKLLKSSPYYNEQFYLENNPDVARSKIEPLAHFILYGGNEGRAPSSLFSSKHYLSKYPDVATSGINPLVHFLRFGVSEGRTLD